MNVEEMKKIMGPRNRFSNGAPPLLYCTDNGFPCNAFNLADRSDSF